MSNNNDVFHHTAGDPENCSSEAEIIRKTDNSSLNQTSNFDSRQRKKGLPLSGIMIVFSFFAVIVACALILTDISITREYERMKTAADIYIDSEHAATEMEAAVAFLAERSQLFVMTGNVKYLEEFLYEKNVTRRREQAAKNLENLIQGSDRSAFVNLNTSKYVSDELVQIEETAMRLLMEAEGFDPAIMPEEIKILKLDDEYLKMSSDELKEAAQNMLFNSSFVQKKERVNNHVTICSQILIRLSSDELDASREKLDNLVSLQKYLSIMVILVVLFLFIIIMRMVRTPLTRMVRKIQVHERVAPVGVKELRFVIKTYNRMLMDNKEVNEKLAHEASHDPLTGLYNRGAYDMLMQEFANENIALILIDVDYFKSVNDNYGHEVGDAILKRVADTVNNHFRSNDSICRIGGDEFAVIMTHVDSSMREMVFNKIKDINQNLQNPEDDLPPVSLSVGVAFSDRNNPSDDIFKDADSALYKVKTCGRNGCEIY